MTETAAGGIPAVAGQQVVVDVGDGDVDDDGAVAAEWDWNYPHGGSPTASATCS